MNVEVEGIFILFFVFSLFFKHGPGNRYIHVYVCDDEETEKKQEESLETLLSSVTLLFYE